MSLSYLQLLQRLYGLPASQRSVEDFLRLFFREDQIGSDQWDAAFKDLTTTSITSPTSLFDSMTLNTSATAPTAPAQGEFWWDETEMTFSFRQNGTVLQGGQETQYPPILNVTGSDIVNGTPVMYDSAIGNSGNIRGTFMDGTDSGNAKLFLGVATEAIADGEVGKVTTFGKVRGVDTTGGSLTTPEVWADADILYVSSTVVGELTNVMPSPPAMALPVAIVISAHTNGTMFVRTTNHDIQSVWGDRANGNYSEFEADGTLVFKGDATVWRDIDFPIIQRSAAANRPTPTTLQGNLTAPRWAVNDYYNCQGQEFVHEWLEGSEVFWHIHVWQNVDATDRYLQFEIEYTWSNVSLTGVAVPANTTVQSGDLLIPGGTGLKFFILPIASFTPTGGNIAGHVKARLKRIAATGTAPSTNPFCEMLQLHVECDTSGSRAMTTK